MMKKLLLIIFTISFTFFLGADWNVGDLHKMGGNGPQLPDETGYDVDFTLDYIGDDFECGESGIIDQIHFWVSFDGDLIGDKALTDIGYIFLQIYSDDPVGDNGIPGEDPDNTYSKPLEALWEGDGNWTELMTDGLYGEQDWYNPWEPYTDPDNHDYYYQINLTNINGMVIVEDPNNLIENNPQPYYQTVGTIYWLLIRIDQTDIDPDQSGDQPGDPIGWKTSQNHWNDDAVFHDNYNIDPNEIWIPLNQHPANPPLNPPYDTNIDLAFVISGSDATLPVTLSSFTGSYVNSTAKLQWTTQSEDNNAGWNLYRSNSDNFNEAFTMNADLVSGAGTTSEPTYYSYTDNYPLTNEETYWYWLESVSFNGTTKIYGPVSVEIEELDPGFNNTPTITQYGLEQNFPNPFNPNTSISFTLPYETIASLSIYNSSGQKIRTLFANKNIAKDQQFKVVWNGQDKYQRTVSSGIYFYKLKTSQTSYIRKMILMK
jgi:hypothetical protein